MNGGSIKQVLRPIIYKPFIPGALPGFVLQTPT